MRLDQAAHLSVAALAAIGGATVGLAEGAPAAILASAGIGLAGYLSRNTPLLTPAVVRAVVGAGLLFLVADAWLLTGDWMLALAHFLLVIQGVKIAGPRTERDLFLVQGTSLAHLAVAAVSTVDFAFAIAFFLYVAAAIESFVLCHLAGALRRAGIAEAPPGTPPSSAVPGVEVLPLAFRAFLAAQVVGAVIISALFFAVIPRMGAGFFHPGGGRTATLSGFSDEVALDDMGRIGRDAEIALRVVFDEDPGPFPYLRGLAFDRYEGGRWGIASDPPRTIHPQPRLPGTPATFLLDEGPGRRATTDHEATPGATVYLAPMGSTVLFTYGTPEAITFLESAPAMIEVDANGSLHLPAASAQDRRYRLEGRANPLAPPPQDLSGRYLDLPASGLDTDRIARLAEEIVRARGATTTQGRVEALAAYLRDHYDYTLDRGTEQPATGDPVLDFLFERPRGHCEYFASALVLLCRSIGVPSRLVNGFAGGERNEIGDYHVFRRSDAHAWVEAYLSDRGWVTFDPTPPAAARTPTGLGAWIAQAADWVRLQWLAHVIAFDLSDQRALANALKEWGDAARTAASRTARSAWRDGPSIPAGPIGRTVLVLLAAAGAFLALRLRAGAARLAGPRWYRAFERLAARRGFIRAPGETPLELSRRAAPAFGPAAAPTLSRLVDALYRVRYGGASLSPAEDADLLATVASLRHSDGPARAPAPPDG